jgi:hypothetical protein
LNNKVVVIKRICKVSELPKEPTPEYVARHHLTIDDTNRLFYANEEFLLNWTEATEKQLAQYYEHLPEEERPTVENVLKKKFPTDFAHDNDYEGDDDEQEDICEEDFYECQRFDRYQTT